MYCEFILLSRGAIREDSSDPTTCVKESEAMVSDFDNAARNFAVMIVMILLRGTYAYPAETWHRRLAIRSRALVNGIL